MITFNELLGSQNLSDVEIEIQHNLEELHKKINIIRKLWGRPMVVTSGLRTLCDQQRINPKAIRSNHLIGRAVDISDPEKKLQQWVLDNESLFEACGLWMEDFRYTDSWCHFQTVQPKSGKRFFIP